MPTLRTQSSLPANRLDVASCGVELTAPISPTKVEHGEFEIKQNEVAFGVVPTQLSALHEFVLSLNEVSQVRNSYNVLRLLVHIDEPQLTILPFGGQIDAHQHAET